MTTLDAMNAIRLTINDPAASFLLRATVERYATHDPVDAVADLEHAAKLYRDLSTALLRPWQTNTCRRNGAARLNPINGRAA